MAKKGFTLTEVLIVIVIAAILVFLIVPRGLRAIAQANYLSDQSNIGSIEEAALLCYSETKDWTSCNSQIELEVEYIDEWPAAPCGGAYVATDLSDPDGVGVNNLSGFCPDPSTF